MAYQTLVGRDLHTAPGVRLGSKWNVVSSEYRQVASSLAVVSCPAKSKTLRVISRGDGGHGANGGRTGITFGTVSRYFPCNQWSHGSRYPLQTCAARMERDDQKAVNIEPGDLDGWVKITGLEIDVGNTSSWEEPPKQKSKPRVRPAQNQSFEFADDGGGVTEWGEIAPIATLSKATVTGPTTTRGSVIHPEDEDDFHCSNLKDTQSIKSATYDAPKSQGGELTGKPGDWECPSCLYINFGSRGECRQCKRWRSDFPVASIRVVPGEVPEGGFNADWACGECGFLNFASRQECRECKSPRPQEIGGGNERALGGGDSWRDSAWGHSRVGRELSRRRGGADVKPGDWECDECGFLNFASRHECCECECPRPSWAGCRPELEQQRMVGDWNCPECGFHNFASRDDCAECAEPRPAGTGKVKKGRDWSCPECGFVNFGSRNECRECMLEKPAPQRRSVNTMVVQLEQAPAPTEKQHGIAKRRKSMRPGEWMCQECGFTNFANRDICFNCGHDPNA